MEDFDDDYFDEEESAYRDCPKCGRSYDEIDYEYQSCSKCGWDAEKEIWGETREPERADGVGSKMFANLFIYSTSPKHENNNIKHL